LPTEFHRHTRHRLVLVLQYSLKPGPRLHYHHGLIRHANSDAERTHPLKGKITIGFWFLHRPFDPFFRALM
jgi:hypothetical protein